MQRTLRPFAGRGFGGQRGFGTLQTAGLRCGGIGHGVAAYHCYRNFAVLDETPSVDSLIAALLPEPIHRAGLLFAAVVIGALPHAAKQSQCTPHLGFDFGYRVIVRRGHSLGGQSHSTRKKVGWRFVIVGHSGSPGYSEDVFRFHADRHRAGSQRQQTFARGKADTAFRFLIVARAASVSQA